MPVGARGVLLEMRVDARVAEQIQSQFRLGNEVVPLVNGIFWVGGGHDGEEVILEHLNGTFGFVSAMYMRGCKLKLEFVLVQDILKFARDFIVKVIHGRRVAVE